MSVGRHAHCGFFVDGLWGREQSPRRNLTLGSGRERRNTGIEPETMAPEGEAPARNSKPRQRNRKPHPAGIFSVDKDLLDFQKRPINDNYI